METSTLSSALKTTFGYDSFRDEQEQIIHRVLDGKDTLVIMPTGGGKSMCFQLPAIVSEGTAIVISPLIALMNDQVTALVQNGVHAACMHSNMGESELRQVEDDLDKGKLKLLYLSPEKMNNPNIRRYLSTKNISLIAIDEAHCVSVWGNDFRPDYVALSSLKQDFSETPMIALTATADQATQEDICSQLNLHSPKTYISSFERKNIVTHAKPGQKRIDQMAKIIRKYTDASGIVYCLSKKDTEKVSSKLNMMGLNTAFYHAGMKSEDRAKIQEQFQNDEINIICATIAFGMGIDKPDIRFVIHYNMPKNLEAYYQEIGRAGRDGKPSIAHMFYSWGDFLMYKRFIDDSPAKEHFRNLQMAKLERMWEYASTNDCRTNGVLSYFGEYRNEKCGHCDNCLNPPIKRDGTIEAQKILSAIYRCNESVNMEMIIDVLRGSQKAEIRNLGLDQIKTFGVGRDQTRLQWKTYIIQLLNKGMIRVDFTNRSALALTPLSIDILKNKKKIELADYEAKEVEVPKKQMKIDLPEDVDPILYSALRKWRIELAREKEIPPYIIFSNKVLESIASNKPISKEQLIKIHGLGKVKIEQYGAAVIQIVLDVGI